ncbi:hypothetical protein M011DRAFT_42605 [Sporormia fimetaria CBS 119925]|uniref:Uncharacterized protein n=1 Tax=Sporormia fimetaria CBS 119925 TaxID=1340428 RepID=A0A6A6VFB9_9PLEO|nr:hypothetical protein M011DRAFT_42605 [Sporormia fimetaria CBS 119925]
MRICYDQPTLVPPPCAEPVYPRPSTSHSMGQHLSQWVTTSKDFTARASARVSLENLRKPRKTFSRTRPTIGRPTISAPMDFRHCDGVDGIQSMLDEASMPVRRRRSFTPLQLSIYYPEGRLSPLPDFTDDAWAEMQKPALALVRGRESVASTGSFRIQRKPVGSGSRRSSVSSAQLLSSMPLLQEGQVSRSESPVPRPTLKRASSEGSSAPSSRILSRLPSPSRLRSNTAPSSASSLRRVNMDVDEAIRELNTIVEERRADAYRNTTQSPDNINRIPPSPSHHVPAIAPTRRMHVRSETLCDIGSAFSTPLPKDISVTPEPLPLRNPPTKLSLTPTIRKTPKPTLKTLIGPLNSNPVSPQTASTTPTTPLARLSAWIRRSVPTTPKSSSPSTPKPFYSCQPPNYTTHSQTAASTRPSTSHSDPRTLMHTRQTSAETATVTLVDDQDSIPSTPALSSRSATPELGPGASPPTPGTTFTADEKPKTKKRVPAPLVLRKKIEGGMEVSRSLQERRTRVPPKSPSCALQMQGLEIAVREGAVRPGSQVGVAF